MKIYELRISINNFVTQIFSTSENELKEKLLRYVHRYEMLKSKIIEYELINGKVIYDSEQGKKVVK